MHERGFGLTRIGHFEDHDGFDGVMLGHPLQTWHLEFTHHRGLGDVGDGALLRDVSASQCVRQPRTPHWPVAQASCQ